MGINDIKNILKKEMIKNQIHFWKIENIFQKYFLQKGK